MEGLEKEVKTEREKAQVSAVQKVTNYIKDKVVCKEYRAGDRIPTEAELCQLINVSRSSVREALKILQANNIIQIKRGDGTYISDSKNITFFDPLLYKIMLTEISMDELLNFREQMEMAAMKLVSEAADEEDIKALKKNVWDMEQVIQNNPDDYMTIYSLDLEFHRILAYATKNHLMKEMYLFIYELFAPLILKNYKAGQSGEVGIRPHRATIVALEKRDFYEMVHAIKLSVKQWGELMSK